MIWIQLGIAAGAAFLLAVAVHAVHEAAARRAPKGGGFTIRRGE